MDFLKKTNIYFIILPVAAAVWAILASTIMTSSANKDWDDIKKESAESSVLIERILELAPERVEKHKEKKQMGRFDYTTVVHNLTKTHKIPESGYNLAITKPRTTRGVMTQGADLTIQRIKIEPACKFLSEMLMTWPSLECDSMTVTNLKTGPNDWKTTMQFKYTYKKQRKQRKQKS